MEQRVVLFGNSHVRAHVYPSGTDYSLRSAFRQHRVSPRYMPGHVEGGLGGGNPAEWGAMLATADRLGEGQFWPALAV